ncbi:hypothetical protein YDYSY3_06930 [Paenibacillus chitinolyticus]|uniref:hypothetical protein n=1 Tax=Paenibacillus chitinolyticus TaxID=79263 RepID=UPI0026E4A051|nr:hypothetical protein [Paenibacillus chitinolyticus]GKS09693.1 hypothetical protein YDYSY3_06930 [Paenibacillus chitinolyticus]
MEHYQTLIGVVLEKLSQSHQELKFNLDGLNSVLANHTAEEIAAAPELLTIRELRDVYADIIAAAEKRFPGLKG